MSGIRVCRRGDRRPRARRRGRRTRGVVPRVYPHPPARGARATRASRGFAERRTRGCPTPRRDNRRQLGRHRARRSGRGEGDAATGEHGGPPGPRDVGTRTSARSARATSGSAPNPPPRATGRPRRSGVDGAFPTVDRVMGGRARATRPVAQASPSAWSGRRGRPGPSRNAAAVPRGRPGAARCAVGIGRGAFPGQKIAIGQQSWGIESNPGPAFDAREILRRVQTTSAFDR